ncbi:hypothetical protein [Vibrio methylphosphonaticus]|uniref:hypothetical protein n=1 Tax=Vibrio methylphosphonaticus TaxID=2946866 RepID=UPI00202A2795|nr:hypothetical protein [Vibrio methylphosphonaticus]MCL9775268.1 hypothetical protein [Vibrio methylphosphonaticus]
MKYIIPALAILTLSGCNSSTNDTTVSPQTPPATHLPQGDTPERPHPDAGLPGHLPGDLVPDRLPITWYPEASKRYGMSIEALDAVCRYKGEHPQMDIHISCQWEQEQLTIVYFTSRGEIEPSYFYDHAFIWVVNDDQISQGNIWPAINHNAVGLEGRTLIVAPDAARFNIALQCENEKCKNITHMLNSEANQTRILSDGTPYYGSTDFSMNIYKQSETFYFHASYQELDTNVVHTNTLHLLDDFPALMHEVLAPAFGY